MDMQQEGKVNFKALLSLIISAKAALIYSIGLEELLHTVALIKIPPRQLWRGGIKSVEGAECTDRWRESPKTSAVARSCFFCWLTRCAERTSLVQKVIGIKSFSADEIISFLKVCSSTGCGNVKFYMIKIPTGNKRNSTSRTALANLPKPEYWPSP